MKSVLAVEGVTDPKKKQLKGILDQLQEKHHAIVFLYKADKQMYGKLIKEMENNDL